MYYAYSMKYFPQNLILRLADSRKILGKRGKQKILRKSSLRFLEIESYDIQLKGTNVSLQSDYTFFYRLEKLVYICVNRQLMMNINSYYRAAIISKKQRKMVRHIQYSKPGKQNELYFGQTPYRLLNIMKRKYQPEKIPYFETDDIIYSARREIRTEIINPSFIQIINMSIS